MSKKQNKSYISINLSLSEAMAGKVVLLLLTIFASLSLGLTPSDYKANELFQKQSVEKAEDTIK